MSKLKEIDISFIYTKLKDLKGLEISVNWGNKFVFSNKPINPAVENKNILDFLHLNQTIDLILNEYTRSLMNIFFDCPKNPTIWTRAQSSTIPLFIIPKIVHTKKILEKIYGKNSYKIKNKIVLDKFFQYIPNNICFLKYSKKYKQPLNCYVIEFNDLELWDHFININRDTNTSNNVYEKEYTATFNRYISSGTLQTLILNYKK